MASLYRKNAMYQHHGATSTTSLAASSEPPPEQPPKAVAKITINVVIPSFLAILFIKISLVPIRCKSVVVRVTRLLASARKTSQQRCVPHAVRKRMYWDQNCPRVSTDWCRMAPLSPATPLS